jgi:GH35 family endo-1,4-beta-xylanase
MLSPRNITLAILIRVTTIALALAACNSAPAVTVNGNSLALKSDGAASGNSWILSNNGYVGTYITLAAPGAVTVDVQATGASNPAMDIVINDTKSSHAVATSTNTYSKTFNLPAGTHFIRTQLTNDPGVAGRQLTINSITVTGATVSNSNTNANALAASDTYISNYRKGNATVKIAGLSAGQQVGVSLKRIAFNFGGGIKVNDDGSDTLLGNTGTALQQNYQSRFNQNFNTVAANGPGYWQWNEPTQGQTYMAGLHQVYDYAAVHGLYSRQHNLIWDMSQPDWVNTLKSQAVTSQTANNNLSAAIQSRMNYYLAGGAKFDEIDLYNESYNNGQLGNANSYWRLYGAAGIAKIYHDGKTTAVGYTPRIMVNDYGILQGSSNPFGAHLDSLQQAGIDAGYGPVVDGIGLQYYSNNFNEAQPTNMFYGLQNMNVRGLPTTLTEFGTFTAASATDSATILDQTMRLIFGNPTSTGMILWDWYKFGNGSTQFAPNAGLYQVNAADWSDATITAAGKAWQDQLGIQDWDANPGNAWTTQLTATAAADGTINFTGYYGNYELTVGGKTYTFSLAKGATNYTLGFTAGDFNLDGVVDTRDYILWRKTTGTPTDYNTWRAHFGQTVPVGAGVSAPIAVPEPRTWLLITVATLYWMSFRSLPMERAQARHGSNQLVSCDVGIGWRDDEAGDGFTPDPSQNVRADVFRYGRTCTGKRVSRRWLSEAFWKRHDLMR